MSTGAINEQRLVEAEAAVQSTLATMTKYENSAKASEAKLIKGDSELVVALAEVQTADSKAGDLQIKAPFAGMVSEHNVDVGKHVRPAGSGDMKPWLKIVNIDKLRAIVHASTDVTG